MLKQPKIVSEMYQKFIWNKYRLLIKCRIYIASIISRRIFSGKTNSRKNFHHPSHRKLLEVHPWQGCKRAHQKGLSQYPAVPDYTLIDSGTQTETARALRSHHCIPISLIIISLYTFFNCTSFICPYGVDSEFFLLWNNWQWRHKLWLFCGKRRTRVFCQLSKRIGKLVGRSSFSFTKGIQIIITIHYIRFGFLQFFSSLV